jgi:hypothetical protein
MLYMISKNLKDFYRNKSLPITAHNRQLGFWGKFERAVLWKFRGELITFGHQTQPAFMRQTLCVIVNSTQSKDI